MPSQFKPCFDRTCLERFLNEQLNESDESTVVEHIDNCRDCQQSLESIAANRGTWHDLRSWPTDARALFVSNLNAASASFQLGCAALWSTDVSSSSSRGPGCRRG